MKRKVDIPSGLGDLLHLRLKTIPSTSREWISINISLSSIVTSRGNNSFCLSWKFRVGWFEQVLKFFSAKQPPIWPPPPPSHTPFSSFTKSMEFFLLLVIIFEWKFLYCGQGPQAIVLLIFDATCFLHCSDFHCVPNLTSSPFLSSQL